jgi:uncharacterized protein (TIGR02246 family)
MIRLHRVFGMFAALLLAGAVQAAAPAVSDEEAVRGLTVSWAKAFNAGDGKAAGMLYAEDAVLMVPGAPPIVGRAAITEAMVKEAASAKAGGTSMTPMGKSDVGVAGDLAWESGKFNVTVKGKVVDTGKYLSVAAKKNGKWLLIRDMWNSDTPPPAPAPAASAPKK